MAQRVEWRDYYQILELSRDDNPDEASIKKRYHELALKWHPDINKDPEATFKIQMINEAFTILGNPKKRQEYDELYRQKEEERLRQTQDSTQSEPGREQSRSKADEKFQEFRNRYYDSEGNPLNSDEVLESLMFKQSRDTGDGFKEWIDRWEASEHEVIRIKEQNSEQYINRDFEENELRLKNERENALNLEVPLSETDLGLIEAIRKSTKLQIGKKYEVLGDDGKSFWEVSPINNGEWTLSIHRTLRDQQLKYPNRKIVEGRFQSLNKVQEGKLYLLETLLNRDNINDPIVPRELRGYMLATIGIANALDNPGTFEPSELKKSVEQIQLYNKANGVEGQQPRSIESLNQGLNTERVREIRTEPREGSPPVR